MEDVADVSIRKARENLSKWEDLSNPIAPISAENKETVIELLSIATNRSYTEGIFPCSSAVPADEAQSDGHGTIRNSSNKNLEHGSTLHSAVEFLRWFNDKEDEEAGLPASATAAAAATGPAPANRMSQACSSSSRWLMLDYVTQLSGHRKECQALLQQLDAALHHLNQLHAQYTSVSTRTTALHTDCEHLLAEQTRLSNIADTIQAKLWYFTQVDAITQKLTSPVFTVTSEGFIPLLVKIDQCIAYMKNNPRCRESSVYLVRYMHCLSRALGLIRSYVTKSLENSTRQVLPKPGETQPNSDNAAVLYYSKFRTNAPRIKSLMSEIEDRLVEGNETHHFESISVPNGYNNEANQHQQRNQSISRQDSSSSRSLRFLYQQNESSRSGHLLEYQNLLSDCHQCYFRQRQQLLGPCVSDAVTQLVANYRKDHCSLVRSGCSFLVHVCEDEHTLYQQFFSLPTPELDDFLEGLCTSLYDGLRPLIIHIDHLETLSELCSILRRGMIEEHLQNSPVQLAALRAVVTRMLQDAQERLVYRAHVYIATDIAGFTASPGDLAYPSKLELMEQIAREIATKRADQRHSRNHSDAASVVSLNSESSYGGERFSRVGSSPADLHGMWYPTLRRTLMCLSKLYRCVDKAIFQGVSLEAVSACVQSLRVAAASIAVTSSPAHAALFQIKHLLILREQLAPFQVESSLKETSLDWTGLKDAAYGLVQQRANLFSWSSNNALLQFIVDGTPHVTEQLMDSKRDVDRELKKVCERLIHTSSESLVGPLTALLAKMDVILAINSREQGVKPVLLKNQPFATPEKINELVSSVMRNIRSKLPKLQRNLHLYLANRDTEFILLKPVRINAATSFGRLAKVLAEHYSVEDALIASCPAVDEVNMIMNALLEEAEQREADRNSSVTTASMQPSESSAGVQAPTTTDHSEGTEAPAITTTGGPAVTDVSSALSGTTAGLVATNSTQHVLAVDEAANSANSAEQQHQLRPVAFDRKGST